MNVGLIQLPKSASNLLKAMGTEQTRQQEVTCTINTEDRYCGEVLTS